MGHFRRLSIDPTKVPTVPVEVIDEHPLGRAGGLVGLYIPGVSFRDLCIYGPPLIANAAGTIGGTNIGPGLTSLSTAVIPGATGNFVPNAYTPPGTGTAGGLSVAVSFDYLGGNPSSTVYVIGVTTSGASYAIALYAAQPLLYYPVNATTQYIAGLNIATGRNVLLGTFNPTTAANYVAVLYGNGAVNTTTSNVTYSWTWGSTGSVYFGNIGTAGNYAAAIINGGWIWANAVLPPALAEWHSAEPFVMLRPIQRRIWFIPSGGGSSTSLLGMAGSRTRGRAYGSLNAKIYGLGSNLESGKGLQLLAVRILGRGESFNEGKGLGNFKNYLVGSGKSSSEGEALIGGTLNLSGKGASSNSGNGFIGLNLLLKALASTKTFGKSIISNLVIIFGLGRAENIGSATFSGTSALESIGDSQSTAKGQINGNLLLQGKSLVKTVGSAVVSVGFFLFAKGIIKTFGEISANLSGTLLGKGKSETFGASNILGNLRVYSSGQTKTFGNAVFSTGFFLFAKSAAQTAGKALSSLALQLSGKGIFQAKGFGINAGFIFYLFSLGSSQSKASGFTKNTLTLSAISASSTSGQASLLNRTFLSAFGSIKTSGKAIYSPTATLILHGLSAIRSVGTSITTIYPTLFPTLNDLAVGRPEKVLGVGRFQKVLGVIKSLGRR